MSLFISPSPLPHTAQAQGLFSSQTAFKKPTFNTNLNKLSNESNKITGFIHPKDLAARQSQSVRILAKADDTEVIMSEPIKKVKAGKGESMFANQVNNNKTHQHTLNTSKLTIDEVFNTPIESKPLNNASFFEESFDDGSNLSFISSHPSIENLDEEIVLAKSTQNHVNLITPNHKAQPDVQSLIVKDNMIQRLSYLNQENMLLNMQNHSMFNQYAQQSVFQPFELLTPLPVNFSNSGNFMCNVPLSMPANDLSQYIQFRMHNQHLLQLPLNFSDKSVNEYVKNTLDTRVPEDGYDSDSYATRSTSVDQGESSSEEKSQKGASPLYNGNDDLYEEEKIRENRLIKKQKAEKLRKQAKQAKKDNKEKKGRSLNLKLDLNPKQLKVERRLNRLQLIRYQQEDMEEDEEIKKFGISELLSRANSTIQDNKEQIDANEVKLNEDGVELSKNSLEYSQAVLPQLGESSKREQRVLIKSVWNPKNIQEEILDNYFQELAEILESPVTDQEAALKLLTNFSMNISLTLETVRGNKEFYSEVFRLKIKRLRRRGM